MIILWHCRGCDKKGDKEISLEEIIKKRKNENQNMIDVVIDLITHECDKKNIGVRVKQ